MRRFLSAAIALSTLACAQTAGPAAGGGTGTADTGQGDTGTTTGGDSGTTTGGDSMAMGDTAKGDSGTATPGGEKSISDLQKGEWSLKCSTPKGFGIVPNAKGTVVKSAIVVTPVDTSGKSLDAVWVQSQGGGVASGIVVVGKKDSEVKNLKAGDIVTVSGEVKEYYCLTEIEAQALTVESQGTGLAVAVTVDVDAIGEKAKEDERELYESVLVAIEGVVVSDPLALGSDNKPHDIYVGKTDADKTLRIKNGFNGIYMQTKEGKANYQKGQKLNIKGVFDYSFETFGIKPLSLTVVP